MPAEPRSLALGERTGTRFWSLILKGKPHLKDESNPLKADLTGFCKGKQPTDWVAKMESTHFTPLKMFRPSGSCMLKGKPDWIPKRKSRMQPKANRHVANFICGFHLNAFPTRVPIPNISVLRTLLSKQYIFRVHSPEKGHNSLKHHGSFGTPKDMRASIRFICRLREEAVYLSGE